MTAIPAHGSSSLFDAPSFVSSTHGRLAYYRTGDGPDVVLVHGWPLSASTFRGIIPHLARRFTVHAFDLPGVGASVPWDGPLDLASCAAALRAAIDHLGLSRYALVGHDSGGSIARLVADGDPRVTALVLGNTEIPGHRSRVVQAMVLAARLPGAAWLLRSFLWAGPIRRAVFRGCFRDPGFVDGGFARDVLRRSLGTPRVAAAQAAFLRAFDYALVDRLRAAHARIAAPVLLVWGTDDRFFPLARARGMVAQFGGGAELVEIQGAKLFAHEDHPEELAAHAMRFLARVAAPKCPVPREAIAGDGQRDDVATAMEVGRVPFA